MFFPFPTTPVDGDGGCRIDHPVLGTGYELNSQAREVLELCDGRRTWEEVLQQLNRRYRLGIVELDRRCRTVLTPLEGDGLLWRRQERMQPGPADPPKFVLWNLTDRCNHRCRHCVVNATRPLAGELSTAEAFDLLDQLAAFAVESLVLSGGEPLLRQDFLEIARRARRNGMNFQVATNATRVTERLADELAALQATTQVSLDGSTPAIHDGFRRASGGWSRTIRGVERLKRAGISVMLAATVTRHNAHDIPDLYRLAGNLGVDVFRILPFVPFGRGARAQALEVTPARMHWITRWLHEQQAAGGLRVAPMEFQCTFGPPPPLALAEASSLRIGCDGAVAYCTVTSTGDVLPCNFFAGVRVHNLHDHPFAWIWEHCDFLRYFRSLKVSDLHGACHCCDWLGSCRGSCIASNFVHGDIFQSNCHCWHARTLEREERRERRQQRKRRAGD
jgi:radical SAM protein with 4Fe4S-binding SPASM domain